MTHARKQLRDAATAALTGLATTGANVFSGRVSPLKSTEMPALLVYIFDDAGGAGAYQGGGPTSEHSAVLKIEGVARGNDDLLDTLDQIGLEVETALFASAPFRALLMVEPDNPASMVRLQDAPEGAALRTASLHMTFAIQYRTRQGDPSIIV